MTQSIDWWAIAAPLSLTAASIVALVGEAFIARAARWLPSAVSLVGTLLALASTAVVAGDGRATFCSAAPLDRAQSCSWLVSDTTVVWWVVMLVATQLVVALLVPGARTGDLPSGELHFLLMTSATGALVIAASGDLVTLVIGMETVSLPVFALVGLRTRDRRGAEAAMKFFIASVVATALTLMGISMVYGATGSMAGGDIATTLALDSAVAPVVSIGMTLTLVGFAFKVAVVPFQAWLPDTYVGAPIPVAAYLSVVSKAAGLAGITILLTRFFPPEVGTWSNVLAVAAAATMTVGNLAALRQRHAVRLLAWSSVAQAGYLLVPLAAGGSGLDVARLQAYLAMYAVVNLAAFAVVLAARAWGAVRGEDLTGLARTHPWLGLGLGFALLCLAGLPPGVVGLVAKVVIFQSAVGAGLWWLAVVMAVNVAIGLVYYLRFLVELVRPCGDGLSEDAEGGPRKVAWSTELVVGITLAAAAVLSVFPGLLLSVVAL